MFSIKSYLSGKTITSAENQAFPKSPAEKNKFFGTPLFNVLLMVALMLGVSGFFRFLEWRKINSQTQIQITDSENLIESEKAQNNKERQPANIFDGEVIDTSRRLREIGALGFAVCLSILDEAKLNKRIPGSINALLNAVASRDLIPPGLAIKNGEIRSQTGKIYLRFQAQPLRLELVSVPDDERSGPALILRFPLMSDGGKNIVYFQSVKVSNITLPKAFAPDAEIIKSGWTMEAWRGSEIGGNTPDFAKMLADEQQNLRSFAPDNSDSQPR
jgi:hypothetical protein